MIKELSHGDSEVGLLWKSFRNLHWYIHNRQDLDICFDDNLVSMLWLFEWCIIPITAYQVKKNGW
jgi:hypothetical protein